jgi:hypothetical protein
MVEVEHLDLDAEKPPEHVERVQEAHGVRPTRDHREHPIAGIEHRVLADRRGDALEHPRDGGRSPAAV